MQASTGHTWNFLHCIKFYSECPSINALRRANEILAALRRPNSMSQFIALVSALVHQYQYDCKR